MGNIQQHSSDDGPIGTKDLIIKQEMDQTQLIDQVQKLQAELDSHKQKFAQLQTDFNDLKTKVDELYKSHKANYATQRTARLKRQQEEEMEANIRKKIRIEETEREAIRQQLIQQRTQKKNKH